MPDLLVQIIGLAAMLGLVGGAYARWIRPRHLDPAGQALLLLIVLTLVGGLLGSTGWWINDPRSFSWTLPPLASRMLASAGWAFGALTLATLARPTSRRVRLTLLMLTIYLAPLLVAILLFHLDRFSFSAPITYAFFVIVLGMTAPSLFFLLRAPHLLPDEPTENLPSSGRVRAWLLAIAVVMTGWGLALFVTDMGPAPAIWPWPGDLLTSRLIAVMLLAIGAGAAYSSRDADAAKVMLAVAAVYGAGAVAANLWSMIDAKPVRAPYLIAFATVLIGSGALWLIEQRASRTATIPR